MSETWWGLYVGLVVNLFVAALLNNGPVEPEAAAWLITLGTANELLGVLLVASPELLPRLQRVGRTTRNWLRRWKTQIVEMVRRLLRRPTPQTLELGTAISSDAAMPLEVGTVTRGYTTLEERVEWLTQQVNLHEVRLNSIAREVQQLQGVGEQTSPGRVNNSSRCKRRLNVVSLTHGSAYDYSGSHTSCSALSLHGSGKWREAAGSGFRTRDGPRRCAVPARYLNGTALEF